MSEVRWIKIATDIFEDEKILLIESMPDSDALIVIWLKMLALAGKSNRGGLLMINDKIPYTEEMLASVFRRPINTVRLAVKTFESFGMVEIINDTLMISNWEKHQNIEGLEKIRETNRERQRRYRESKRLLTDSNVSVTLRSHNSNALDIDKEIEIGKELDKEKVTVKKKRNLIPPTKEMVEEYILENGYSVDPDAFMDYYDSKGWMVGKTKMKDWQASVRNWNRNQYQKPSNNPFLEMLKKGDIE